MITSSYDNTSEEVLKPSHIASPIPDFPETAVVLFGQRVLEALLAQSGREVISTVHAGIEIPIYKVCHDGQTFAVYLSWLGGPVTVSLLEEVIVKGARRVLLFGSCGTLDSSLTAGHMIVPTEAYRDEGTSYHYMPASDGAYVEVRTAPQMAEILRALQVPFTCGKTWTTDAFYRETRNNVELRKKDGCLVVEMECASAMAMAHFRGIDAYQFLFAADNLDAEAWDARILGTSPQELSARLARIVREVAVRLP